MNWSEDSVFSKKADELTVGESVQVGVAVTAVVTAVSIAIPFAFLGVVAGVSKIKEKLQTRKAIKELEKSL